MTISGSGNAGMELEPFLVGSGPNLTKQIWGLTAAGNLMWEHENAHGRATIVGGPLRLGSKLYFDPPIDHENWKGPLANGTWTSKGHY